MDGAPPEFKGKEYGISLDGEYYLAGIYDTWERNGESLDSLAIVTMSSEGHEKLRAIWHERTPIILNESEAEQWLDPKTTPDQARRLMKLFASEKIEIQEIVKKADPSPDRAKA